MVNKFTKGDIVRHKLGSEKWLVTGYEPEWKCWPWSKPEPIVEVLKKLPIHLMESDVVGRYSPESLVSADQ